MITLEAHLAAHPYRINAHKVWCACGWEAYPSECENGMDAWAAHVAAAWREARTVRTVEQLEALPVGVIVVDCDGFKAERYPAQEDCHWLPFGEAIDFPHEAIGLPALVVWSPEDGAA